MRIHASQNKKISDEIKQSSSSIHRFGKAGQQSATQQPRRYMYGLDGLRALAVLAVMAYHLNLDFVPGGLFGVGIFFVLSGYLITDLLWSQWQEQGSIALGTFYIRRARRLLPGMFTVIGAIMIWLFFADPSRLSELRGDIAAGALYISNWWYIFHHVSYFESFSAPSPLGHFWSLAVEEQFYILWPILLLLLAPLMRKKLPLFMFILGLALLSVEMMALLYNPDLDPSRVYYGTDTRAFALLAGAALAVILPSHKLSSSLSIGKKIGLELIGIAALVFLITQMLTGSEYDSALYTGGMALQALATMLLIAALAHPSSVLGRLFGIAPLRWIGRHSYGLYLWHYPVIVLTTPNINTDGVSPLRVTLQVLTVFVLAALSFKYIEDPIRQRGFRAFGSGIWQSKRRRTHHILCSRTIALVGIALIGLAAWRLADDSASPVTASSKVSVQTQASQAVHRTVSQPHAVGAKPQSLGASTKNNPNALNSPQPSKSISPVEKVDYTVIGDSVILDAKPDLEEQFDHIHVDGKVGRQMWEAPDLLSQLDSQNQLGDRVVIELGTNGSFNSKKLNEVLEQLKSKKQVYLVTVRVPRAWERTVNRALSEAAEAYPNVSIIDWHDASSGRSDYFSEDGVHLTQDGAEAFTALVKQHIKQKEISMK
ncbi:acyltransferase family protein [Saccharibacillus sp. JS10]|uniref:acyltransferase family protein n=1 Tax=Saccharibacillus sp. JS10 TaxID=2950552 RepID=UPI0021095D2F|nr:acyltransferase family protein [Saccharibacillus sp. JS10]MCQ4087341.1 acetyltransferase [Saccharibacillus sp. JS10]